MSDYNKINKDLFKMLINQKLSDVGLKCALFTLEVAKMSVNFNQADQTESMSNMKRGVRGKGVFDCWTSFLVLRITASLQRLQITA